MLYEKSEVIDYVWQYSKYYGNLLVYCERISMEEAINGHASLTFLFNILENIIKSRIHDYDINFINAINKLKLEIFLHMQIFQNLI